MVLGTVDQYAGRSMCVVAGLQMGTTGFFFLSRSFLFPVFFTVTINDFGAGNGVCDRSTYVPARCLLCLGFFCGDKIIELVK